MIQRIQTLYLLLTSILSFLFLNGHIITFADEQRNLVYIGSEGLTISGNTGGTGTFVLIVFLAAVNILVFCISLVSIFLFKKRKAQIKLTAVCIILCSLLAVGSVSYIVLVKMNYSGRIMPGTNIFLIPFMLLLLILAYRGIRKDENLVRSLDRIR